jgi:hypothetical protein
MRGFSILLSRVGRALLFGALVVAASACCGSAGQPAVVSSLEGITEYRLDNGLGLLLCPDSSVATITVMRSTTWARARRGWARRAWPTCWSTC